MAIKLRNIYGIPLYLDYSTFLIIALIAYTVGFGFMPASYPGLSWSVYLSIGILSAVFLFVSILIHELAHSIVAKNNDIKVTKITLYFLGGISEMPEEPPTADFELKVSAAGPLMSIVIAVVSFLGWISSIHLHASVLIQGPLQYLYIVNALVSGFNLIPAFPMDGGRILRSLIWRRNGDLLKSTKIASNVGRVFAYLFMVAGIFFLFFVDLFDGLWLLLIGWFVSSAASSELNQLRLKRDLSGLKADDLMTRTIDSVSPEITLSELSSRFFEFKHNGFPLVDSNGDIVGCVTTDDLRKTKKNLWDSTFVKDIMTPKEKLVTVKNDEPAELVVSLMSRNQIGRVFVLDSKTGKLTGLVTRSDVMKVVQVQESILGGSNPTGQSSADTPRFISVEKGMMFEIECPVISGVTWFAAYNTGEFTLISQNLVQISGGGQSMQFTFEAKQVGRFSITLHPNRDAKPNPRESITYWVSVA